MKPCCYAVLLWLAVTATAHGQSVAGRALAAADRQPIAHAFIVLLDENGQTRGGALSDSTGRWHVRAPAPGRYRLRLERIGYDNVESDWLQLRDSLQLFDFIVTERPFMLEAVRAESGGRGCSARSDAEAVYRLWEEVQKALRLTRWTETNNALSFTTMTYTRETDAQLHQVLSESRNLRSARAAAPFGTLSPAELLSGGFSRRDDDDLILHGVDARVLLSPEFVDHYCFRIRSSDRPELIGLGFEPMRKRDATQVRGVLWVDRRTAELRHMAYQYVGLPATVSAYDASAEVHFRKLQTGQWVIDRWWIRTPRVQERQANPLSSRSQTAIELAGYHEDGGVLMVAEDRSRSIFQLIGGGAIEGTISGRTAGEHSRPLAFLSGTPHTAPIDADGRFRIMGVPPGTYALAVRDAVLDDLRLPSRVDSVRVVAGQTLRRNITWPTQREILRAVCPNEAEESGDLLTGLLYGDVLHPQTGQRLNLAKVQVEWTTVQGTTVERWWRTAYTNSDGRYNACWIPSDTEVTLTITAPDMPARTQRVTMVSPIQRHDVR